MDIPDESRVHLSKVTAALPSIIGKTISDVVIMTNRGKVFLFLVFADGTHFEFYDMEGLNTGRWTAPGGVEDLETRLSASSSYAVVPPRSPATGR